MTKEELNQKIAKLENAAAGLEEPDRTLTEVEINNLKNQIDGMSLSDISEKMATISPPDLADLDAQIEAANDATKSQAARVDGINTVLGIIRSGLGLVL